ncbi:uncharacterized protein LOC105163972 [Sesamum indicum]|uniref:Uncharacterized protein LOC105163972 n=1 Tax=Sesamum indicum TaxID=4182 RepID=A0A6I9T8V0_SESIN|nr:uncharacterized protein LOC105163972 [Sesamum indicum]
MRRALARLRATQKGARGFAALQSPAPSSENGVGLAPRAMARNLQLWHEYDFGGHTWNKFRGDAFQWVFLSGPAAIILGASSMPSLAEDVSIESSSTDGTNIADSGGLRKIEDGSVVSNEHTSKWRIFTDNGRNYFMQGNVEQAEKFFRSALEEAREGFGERDPHVASACNNLAELFRLKKDFESAEPLYLEAINILEKHFGIDDIRVGAALHNLGQFYLIQRILEKARVCYERALKIKRRVLGEAHPEYADTLYHLGTVLHLQGKEKDAEDLIVDSIRILDAIGQGESFLCVRRMQYLAQMYIKSNRFTEAEILLRKILHTMELSKGWKSFDTVVAAERLALVLQISGELREAEDLLERCLDARKKLLPDEHIQNAANMLYTARLKMQISNQLMRTKSSQAMAELDVAKDLLQKCIRVARHVLVQVVEQKGNKGPTGIPRKTRNEAHSAALILLQSLNALGSLEIMKLEFPGAMEYLPAEAEAEAALCQCVSTYKEFASEHSISDSPQVKAEYLSCLRHLYNLVSKGMTSEIGTAKEIKDEIRRVEDEVSKAAGV